MNDDAAKQLIAYMAGAWRSEFTEAQVAVWRETFEGIKPAHAREALRNLKMVKTFLPSHAEFFEAVEAIAHREAVMRAEIDAGATATEVCICGGNGWVELDRVGQGHVERCPRCNPAPATRDEEGNPIEHKAGCSCARCFYGPKRYAIIQSGRDGMGPRRKTPVDNEDLPSPPPDPRYEQVEAEF